MKVRVRKNLLLKALDRISHIATKSILPDYTFNGRITIEVKKTQVIFTSSNGFICASCTILEDQDPNIPQHAEVGTCTTDAIHIRDVVRRLGSSDSVLELFDDGTTLTLHEVGTKRTKVVKLPRESNHHDRSVIRQPDGDSMSIETEHFSRGIRTVIPFQCKASYKFAYQVVCLHWINSELRMVCGDGGCFAVFSIPRQDSSKREMKRTIPCSQVGVLCDVLSESQTMEMVWKQKDVLWIKTNNNIEILVRGIPDVDYVSYENNAFLFDDAKAVVDIKVSDISECVELLGVLKDEEAQETQGKFHSCHFYAPSTDGHVKFEISRDQGKYQCEYEVPASYHDMKSMQAFHGLYAHQYFSKPIGAARHPYLRFYLIEESGVINVKDVDLAAPDGDGIPQIKEEPDKCSLSFFFAAMKNDGVSSE